MEKLLVTSNFSFSHNVFSRYISLVRQNGVLFCNGLNDAGSKFECNENIQDKREIAMLSNFALHTDSIRL